MQFLQLLLIVFNTGTFAVLDSNDDLEEHEDLPADDLLLSYIARPSENKPAVDNMKYGRDSWEGVQYREIFVDIEV